MKPKEIAERRARLRIPKKLIADRSGLDEGTVKRACDPAGNPLRGTLTKIEQVIVAEELALRDHLLELHPVRDQVADQVRA